MKRQSAMYLLAAGMVLTPGIAIVGCGNSTSTTEVAVVPKEEVAENASTNDSTIKVFVYTSGKITANGLPVNFIQLDSALSKLKKVKGEVFYSRENLQADPPDESMKVIDMIVKYELPVQFYMDKSFTQIADIK